jgi:hypothetical protein
MLVRTWSRGPLTAARNAFWKTIQLFLIKLNILIAYDPAVVLLGIKRNYSKELKTKICTQMFLAA